MTTRNISDMMNYVRADGSRDAARWADWTAEIEDGTGYYREIRFKGDIVWAGTATAFLRAFQSNRQVKINGVTADNEGFTLQVMELLGRTSSFSMATISAFFSVSAAFEKFTFEAGVFTIHMRENAEELITAEVAQYPTNGVFIGFRRCPICNDTYVFGRGVCHDCEGNTHSCPHCDTRFVIGEGYTGGSSDYEYCCLDCYDEDNSSDDDDNYGDERTGKNKIEQSGFTLVPKRTFGVEIEVASDGVTANGILDIMGITSDGSVTGDSEFVTGILQGDAALLDLCTAIEQINGKKVYNDNSNGLHLHVSVSDLSGVQLRHFVEFCLHNEEKFLNLVPKVRRNNHFCERLTKTSWASDRRPVLKVENVVAAVVDGTYDDKEVAQRIKYLKEDKKSGNRYRWVNLCPVMRQGTIEIRLHSGTHSPVKVAKWVQLWTWIIEAFKQNLLRPITYSDFGRIVSKLPCSAEIQCELLQYLTERTNICQRMEWVEMEDEKGFTDYAGYCSNYRRFYTDADERLKRVYKSTTQNEISAAKLAGIATTAELKYYKKVTV